MMQAVRRARTLLTGTGRSYHKVQEWKVPNMDELPVPTGSWQAQNEANQRKYNATLAVGLCVLGGTITVLKSVVFFNSDPPDSID